MSEFLSYWLNRALLELAATKLDLVMTQKKLIDANWNRIALQQKLICEQKRRLEAERAYRANFPKALEAWRMKD